MSLWQQNFKRLGGKSANIAILPAPAPAVPQNTALGLKTSRQGVPLPQMVWNTFRGPNDDFRAACGGSADRGFAMAVDDLVKAMRGAGVCQARIQAIRTTAEADR